VTHTQTACDSVHHTDFYDFKNLNFYKSIRHGKVKGDPEVRDIRAFKYDPIQKIFFIKSTLMMIIKNYQIIADKLPCLYKCRLPLTLSKWKDLQKLKIVLPRDAHDFYDNLSHHQVLKARKTCE
ncbi:DDE-1 domain-containing protein, partial [Aphis craccivora]